MLALSTMEEILFGDANIDEPEMLRLLYGKYRHECYEFADRLSFHQWFDDGNTSTSWCYIRPHQGINDKPILLICNSSRVQKNETLFYDDRLIGPTFIATVERYLISHGIKRSEIITWTNWKDVHIKCIYIQSDDVSLKNAFTFALNDFIISKRPFHETMEPLDVN